MRDTASPSWKRSRRSSRSLDAPTPQILIEGKFVEVSGERHLEHQRPASISTTASSIRWRSSSPSQPGNNNYAANFNTTVAGALSESPCKSPASFAGDGGMSFGFGFA